MTAHISSSLKCMSLETAGSRRRSVLNFFVVISRKKYVTQRHIETDIILNTAT